MLSLFVILQNSTGMASASAALESVNKFLVAFFLIGIGFLLLLSINSNRRSKMKEPSGKALPKEKIRHHGGDLLSQLPNMTKEELKAMILKEKAACIPQPGSPEIRIIEPDGDMASPPEETGGQDKTPQLITESAPEVGKSTIPPDVALLSSILIGKPKSPSENINKERLPASPSKFPDSPAASTHPDSPPTPPPPHHGKVERSVLSNELPDEYKRKSRKI
jgi:hypothetical protein